MQACSQDTNQHVLTLHAGMYHHYMLVGKIGTWWLLRSVHACMYQKPNLDGCMDGVLLFGVFPVDVGNFMFLYWLIDYQHALCIHNLCK